MKADIESRFQHNLQRVESLIGLYPSDGSGRRAVGNADLLRAAVTFLHAALEDLLRSMLAWRLPLRTEPEAFSGIRFPAPGDKGKEQISVGALAAHQGKAVEEVIREAVDGHLLYSNYNNVTEVASALGRIAVRVGNADMNRLSASLEAMMKRRHWIVHRADRNERSGSGHHPARSISKAEVERWVATVRDFGQVVLQQVN